MNVAKTKALISFAVTQNVCFLMARLKLRDTTLDGFSGQSFRIFNYFLFAFLLLRVT